MHYLFSFILSCPVFEQTHAVYSVKGVSVIPLVESRANAALQTLARVRTASTTRYPTQFDELSDSGIDPPDEEASNSNKNLSSPHVKFATEDQIKMMTPLTSHGFEPTLDDDSTPSSPSSSVASTPSSDISLNTNNVARALADKLSFWSRLSKRASRPTFSAAEQGLAHDEEALRSLMRGESPTDLNEMMENGVKEPAEVLDSILQATAPPPPTVEEKHGELEEKIIRECVREFTRGGMYFSYNFGKLESCLRLYGYSLSFRTQTSLGLFSISKNRSRRIRSKMLFLPISMRLTIHRNSVLSVIELTS